MEIGIIIILIIMFALGPIAIGLSKTSIFKSIEDKFFEDHPVSRGQSGLSKSPTSRSPGKNKKYIRLPWERSKKGNQRYEEGY